MCVIYDGRVIWIMGTQAAARDRLKEKASWGIRAQWRRGGGGGRLGEGGGFNRVLED